MNITELLTEEIIDILNNAINILEIKEPIYFSNISTIIYKYKKNLNKIVIETSISNNKLLELIRYLYDNNLLKDIEDIKDIEKQILKNKEINMIIKMIKINIKIKNMIDNNILYKNIYLRINDKKIVNIINNNIIEDIHELENDIINSNNNYIIFDIILNYLISKSDELEDYIIKFIEEYSKNKKIRNKIINEYDMNKNKYFDKFIEFMNIIEEYSLLNEKKELFEKYGLLNKILYKTEKIDDYGIIINDCETYIKLIMISINNIIKKKKYIKYIKNNYKTDDKIDTFLEDNRLKIYRNIKEKNDKKYFMTNINQENIKNLGIFLRIISVLFYSKSWIDWNIEPMKYGFISKYYYNVELTELKDIINFYNNIIKNLSLDNIIEDNNFLYKIIKIDGLKKYEFEKIKEIPKIKKKYEDEKDNINIIDYQDGIGLIYELIYINRNNFEQLNITYEYLKELCDEILESILSNIRMEKILEDEININNDDIKVSFY